MKLLIYSHFFAPSIGGVESIVLSLAEGLAELRTPEGAREFDLTLVTETPAGDFDDRSLAFRVVRQPKLIQLWGLIRAAGIIHVAGPALPPLLLARLACKAVVIEHHGFQTICPNGQLFIEPANAPCPGHFMAKRYAECFRCNAGLGWLASRKLWLLTFVRRFLCAHAAANITPTQWLGSLLRLPKIVYIAHGLEAVPALSRPKSASRTPVIAFQGRLVSTKGVRLLFEAAQVLRTRERSFELLIIGEGPERDSLAQLAQQTQLTPQVRFAGRLSTAQIEAALAQAAAIVVPSLGGEVFGLVVAENMQRGLPVVASDLGAFAEVLGDTGVVFRTGDATDLARKLAGLLDDPGTFNGLGCLARQRVLNLFSRNRMIEGHARIYRGIGGAANF